jgi:hypothetical protein
MMDLELSGEALLAHSSARVFEAVRDFLRG